MPIRFLLLAIALYIGFKVYKTWQAQQNAIHRRREPEAFEPMVRCRRCGVHLPASAVSPTGLCGKCSA